jgi:tellurite resistance protein
MGLAGLADAWRTANILYGVPSVIGDVLYLVSAVVYAILASAVATKLILRTGSLLAELRHPIVGPFYSLFPISGMLLAIGLGPHAYEAAQALFIVFLVATFLYGGWLTGRWIAGPLGDDSIHPGYFLPTVAGGLIGGEGASDFGLVGLGWISFGIGVLCWILLGSLILNRLLVRPPLPTALIPTLAIEAAPPAVAGISYAVLTGGRIDMVAYALLGYVLLMVLVQLSFLPMYRSLSFAPSFWAFTFSYAAVAVDAMRWIRAERTDGATLLGCAVLGAITLFIGGIALRSLVALRRGQFLPVSAP